MKFLHTADRERYRRMTTDEIREAYLIDDMFIPGELTLCYTDVERSIVGSATPTGKGKIQVTFPGLIVDNHHVHGGVSSPQTMDETGVLD